LPTRQPGTTRVPKLQDRIPPPQEQMLDPVQQILDAGKMQASQEVQRMQQAPAPVASAPVAPAPTEAPRRGLLGEFAAGVGAGLDQTLAMGEAAAGLAL